MVGAVVRNLVASSRGPGLRNVDKLALGNSVWAQLLVRGAVLPLRTQWLQIPKP